LAASLKDQNLPFVIENFFDKLSYRFRSENDLSDITWALGESCPKFQQLFLKFFFNEISDFPKITVFKREHTEDYCRPDFYIRADDVDYVIECKINDRNQHFEDYKLQFPKARFGYITNYALSYPDKDFVIKEWKDFKSYLTQALMHVADEKTKALISGYVGYLTNVCGIFNLKKMKLTDLSSLYHFNQLIRKIATSLENRETGLYNQGKPFDIFRSGQYFSLKIDETESIYPWLGIYYTERVCIYFEINEKWCKPIYSTIDINKLASGGEFYEAPYYDTDCGAAYTFELRDKYFVEFNDETTTVEEQERIVRSFVTEVLHAIGL